MESVSKYYLIESMVHVNFIITFLGSDLNDIYWIDVECQLITYLRHCDNEHWCDGPNHIKCWFKLNVLKDYSNNKKITFFFSIAASCFFSTWLFRALLRVSNWIAITLWGEILITMSLLAVITRKAKGKYGEGCTDMDSLITWRNCMGVRSLCHMVLQRAGTIIKLRCLARHGSWMKIWW